MSQSLLLRPCLPCRLLFLLALLLGMSAPLRAQDVMMQAWFWDYPSTVSGKTFMAHLAEEADHLGEVGFTQVWLPPLSKGSGGGFSVGYDVRDYYDLGQYGNARWGSRTNLTSAINALNSAGITPVADMVWNHRDGGRAEDNPAVEGWIENLNFSKVASGDQPMPSDRWRCYLPLGGSSGNGPGTYYLKVRSASEHPNFFGKSYTVMAWTGEVGANFGTAALSETDANGGADCGEGFDVLQLGRRMNATTDGDACKTDEFALTLDPDDFAAAGDTLWILLFNNAGGLNDYSDHYIYGLWNSSLGSDVQNQLRYQTYTDFSQVSSGQGVMDRSAFRPNGNPTQLNGDWDAMWFFYDMDQTVPAVQDAIFDWTAWLWDDIGIRGYRLDAVKHYPDWFNGLMMNRMRAAGKIPEVVVGEFFDGNPFTLKNWVDQATAAMDDETRAAVRIRAFDFALRDALKQACDAFGFDARNVFESGMVDAAGSSGFDAITFVNNHDFRYPGQEVINNPELAYAYILTNNRVGLPCVFYPDYFLGGAMRYQIQGLMEVQRRYIAGSTVSEYLNEFGSFYSGNYLSGFSNSTLIYQLSGGPSGRSAVVVINFAGETLRLDHTLNTGFVPVGDTLTDIFSVSPNPFAIVNGSSQAYFEVPARSFGVWVQGDLRSELISIEEPVSGLGTPELIPDFAWTLAPNPASNELLLSWNAAALPPQEQSGTLQWRIFGTDGRVLLQERVGRGVGSLRLPLDPRWAEGVYWLELSMGVSRSTRSFALQR
jgi:glycosidase